MSDRKLVLPTTTRLQEDTAESGGWSRFFDAVLASLEREERDPRSPGVCDDDRSR